MGGGGGRCAISICSLHSPIWRFVLSSFSRREAKSWGKGLCSFYLMEKVFETCAWRFPHAKKFTILNMWETS